MNLKYRMINSLIDWIEENLETPLCSEQISLHAGYSRWYMQRMFKEVTGTTLWHYIIQRRLAQSLTYLADANEAILDIACRLQFDSQQTFTRVFKAYFGITPGKYRREGTGLVITKRLPLEMGIYPARDAYTLVLLQVSDASGKKVPFLQLRTVKYLATLAPQ